MQIEDIAQVLEVDRESYTLPWPASAYRREILHNRNARYVVLRQHNGHEETDAPNNGGELRPRLSLPFFRWPRTAELRIPKPFEIVGYAGMWLMLDEAHITTIAMRETWRRRGLGELLLASLVLSAHEMGATRVTLEVRVSNDGAKQLYRKYGFREEGLRRRYYSDNNEDAHIMTTENIREPQYRQRFEHLVDTLQRRLSRDDTCLVSAPAFALCRQPGRARGAQ